MVGINNRVVADVVERCVVVDVGSVVEIAQSGSATSCVVNESPTYDQNNENKLPTRVIVAAGYMVSQNNRHKKSCHIKSNQKRKRLSDM